MGKIGWRGHTKHKVKKDICRRCSLCCLIKEYHADLNLWVVTKEYCPYLDWIQQDGKMIGNCSIYNDRWERQVVSPGVICLSAEAMAKIGFQPPTCGYVKHIPNYRCIVMGFEEN